MAKLRIMATNKQKRLVKVVFIWILFLTMGLILGAILNHWNLNIPCIFRMVTGWKCPGCGVTRMCRSIIRLDFKSAFWYNPVVFLMLPLIGVLLINMSYNYVKNGSNRLAKPLEKLVIVMIVVLIVFGVLRNLV